MKSQTELRIAHLSLNYFSLNYFLLNSRNKTSDQFDKISLWRWSRKMSK